MTKRSGKPVVSSRDTGTIKSRLRKGVRELPAIDSLKLISQKLGAVIGGSCGDVDVHRNDDNNTIDR